MKLLSQFKVEASLHRLTTWKLTPLIFLLLSLLLLLKMIHVLPCNLCHKRDTSSCKSIMITMNVYFKKF